MDWFDRIKKAVNPARIVDKTDKKNDSGKTNDAKEGPLDRVSIESIPTDRDRQPLSIESADAAAFRQQAVAKLSPREKAVFHRCLEAAKMKDIAVELKIKTSTVNGYCKEVYKKLGVHSKGQLILLYSEFREAKTM